MGEEAYLGVSSIKIFFKKNLSQAGMALLLGMHPEIKRSRLNSWSVH